jgi:hypothetical protein
MAEAARHRSAGDAKSAFAALERAHVLGQLDFVPHLRVHWQMLRAGWAAGDRREVAGQLMRLPVGNTGGSNVSAFKPMAIPPDLERLIEDRDR